LLESLITNQQPEYLEININGSETESIPKFRTKYGKEESFIRSNSSKVKTAGNLINIKLMV
jgi:hypothetical protein